MHIDYLKRRRCVNLVSNTGYDQNGRNQAGSFLERIWFEVFEYWA